MTEAVRNSFRIQADACQALGSPFTARILRLLADGLTPGTPVADRVLGWPGDPAGRTDALALRLAGGLHALALQGDPPALRSFYTNPARYTDIEALAVLLDTTDLAPLTLLDWLASAPQTNEVRRSAPLAHLSMESDGTEPGAALTLRLWPGALTIPMGRVDFHGRWVDWQAPIL